VANTSQAHCLRNTSYEHHDRLTLSAFISNSENTDVFIVTTKQARFASAIMSEKAGLRIPEHRLFSQTVSGVPKTEVLIELGKNAIAGSKKIFVEDKMSGLGVQHAGGKETRGGEPANHGGQRGDVRENAQRRGGREGARVTG
jgi:hypothetical protein